MSTSSSAKTIQTHLIATASKISSKLEHAIASAPALSLLPNRDSSLPERLCRAIAGQQLSVKAARSIWTRVTTSAGTDDLMQYVSRSTAQDLRACGLSAAKSKAMQAVARATLSGQLDEDKLSAMTSCDRRKQLTAIWGVGPWTADMMNIFYFADPDIWPDGDVTARKTLEQLTSKRRKTIRTAANFAPYRSYLALYMWRQVDAAPDE